ncbi:uncharacterized protein K02A2.6-like [Stylophora pistillata]|uniref:uncharacterized protein K02A2.6-like n=1 Tax=Stylophora pistillata TaxID=50429 RepID=UPI000C055247|nr:uncharacterized protein K02A2.6-like [Stylophora pistillata]
MPRLTLIWDFSVNRAYRLEWRQIPAIFQQTVDPILSGLNGVGGILDDLIVTGPNDKEHIRSLENTLKRLDSMGVKLKKSKCVLMKPSVEYFAFVVDRHGIHLHHLRPLTLLLGPKRGIPVLAASRLQSWAIQLSAYQYDIEYRASKDHANADALSRLPRKTVEEPDDWNIEADQVNRVQMQRAPITVSQIREATRGDPVLSRVMHCILHGWSAEKCISDEFKIYYNKQDEFTVEDGCILRGTRAVIPAKYQAAVLSELHLNHPGMVRMKSLARLHVWWPSLDHDAEQTVRDCHACQANRCKSPEKVSSPWIWPTRPWQRIHVDFAGPFNGQMFLIVVDAKSKWIEVFPMSSTTASTTIRALRFLFATHGLPEVIISHNGPQFVAQEMKDFLKSNGIRHCLSAPYHPASNGETERAVRTFKESIKTMKDEPGTQADKLARLLLSYRTTPHTATGCTPAEILMGRRIRTRLDALHPDLSAGMSEKTKLGNHTTRRNFLPGDPVMVRDYRDRKRPWIKGVVQDRVGPVTYHVMRRTGNCKICNSFEDQEKPGRKKKSKPGVKPRENSTAGPKEQVEMVKGMSSTLSFQQEPATLSFSVEVKSLESYRGSEPVYPEQLVENIKHEYTCPIYKEPLELVKRTRVWKTTDEVRRKTARQRSKVVAETRITLGGGAGGTQLKDEMRAIGRMEREALLKGALGKDFKITIPRGDILAVKADLSETWYKVRKLRRLRKA